MESSTSIHNVLLKARLKVKFRSPGFKKTRNMTPTPNHNTFLIFAVFKALEPIFLSGSVILFFSLTTKHANYLAQVQYTMALISMLNDLLLPFK